MAFPVLVLTASTTALGSSTDILEEEGGGDGEGMGGSTLGGERGWGRTGEGKEAGREYIGERGCGRGGEEKGAGKEYSEKGRR